MASIQLSWHHDICHTLVLLDGEHGQSVDGFIGGQRGTEGTAQNILEGEHREYPIRKKNNNNDNKLNIDNAIGFYCIAFKISSSNILKAEKGEVESPLMNTYRENSKTVRVSFVFSKAEQNA